MPRSSTVHAIAVIGIDMAGARFTRSASTRPACFKESVARTHCIEVCKPATLPSWHRMRKMATHHVARELVAPGHKVKRAPAT
jgi:hypothetical protein